MAMVRALVILGAAQVGSALARGSHCYEHEEVRQGAIWVVDCHGEGRAQLSVGEYGAFAYRAAGAEWNSGDARMGTIAADLPGGERCDANDVERWGRCLGLPDQFAWCGTASTARFAMDTKFPSYASGASDLAREAAVCLPANTTVRVLPPMRAYNERAVRKAREARENTETVVLVVILGAMLCCSLMCGRSERRYASV
jgi:hypothetical protein